MVDGAPARAECEQPRPELFEEYCRDRMPSVLTEVCGIGTDRAAQIGADMLARAESFAALDDQARGVLIAPFAEEVAWYQPVNVPLHLLGAVAVIVRGSILEQAHADGLADASAITFLTTHAAGPLSHFLAARREPVAAERNLFAALPAAWPRAWACLHAVTLAYQAGGGRWPSRKLTAPVPQLPAAGAPAPESATRPGSVLLSGIDPSFDQAMVTQMQDLSEGPGGVWVCASLSRISRNLDKLLYVLEYLLAHEVSVLTANYLLRSRDAWVRRGDLVPVDHRHPVAAWQEPRGLSGAHRAIAAAFATQMKAGQ
jgi:hypothetical protein